MIGMTTTIPVEVLFAAGVKPVDLNNIFITAPDCEELITEAERAGFPAGSCAWIKGLYSVALRDREIDTIVAVTQGDCSNTHALMETLEYEHKRVIPFDFPFNRDPDLLQLSINKLTSEFNTSLEAAEQKRTEFAPIRKKLAELDRMTWQNSLPGATRGHVSGNENHTWLVTSSDFNSNPQQYESELDEFLIEAAQRPAQTPHLRIGYLGVPPIFTNLYDFLEQHQAKVVYNEVQRQFSMPFECSSLVEQYTKYTYPYDIFARIDDIKREIERRRIDGLIHYTQTFCFRQIQDVLLRKLIDVPILTIEGDRPSEIDARTGIRIEGFLELLSNRKH